MFCMFPDSRSEWKKGATGQSFILKEITTYRIGTLIDFRWPREKFTTALLLLEIARKHSSFMARHCLAKLVHNVSIILDFVLNKNSLVSVLKYEPHTQTHGGGLINPLTQLF